MDPPDDTGQMDLNKLKNHVKELGDKVSDKAKSLLDTMEQYQKVRTCNLYTGAAQLVICIQVSATPRQAYSISMLL